MAPCVALSGVRAFFLHEVEASPGDRGASRAAGSNLLDIRLSHLHHTARRLAPGDCHAALAVTLHVEFP